MLEHKTLALIEAKAVADEATGAGAVEGYASVFGGVDSYGDTIERGAYAETLPDFLKDGFIAWGHDWSSPVATPTDIREDARGLYLVADFHTDPEAQRVRTITTERLARGKSMGLSIGYEAVAWEFRKVDTPVRNAWGELTDQVRVLTRIKLYEVSLVTVPADGAARVVGAKATYRLADEEALVRARVPSLTGRWRSLVALEGGDEHKAGAAISRARRERLVTLRDVLRTGADDLDGLLIETEPKPADAGANDDEPVKAAVDGRALFNRDLAVRARRHLLSA